MYLCTSIIENQKTNIIREINMANHKSSLKRIRSNEAKRLRNRYQHKTTRTMVKKLRLTHDKVAATDLYKKVSSALDKLAKKNVIHKNKASNLKSKLAKLVNKLA
jgi:small subunit ribosomal protein S20